MTLRKQLLALALTVSTAIPLNAASLERVVSKSGRVEMALPGHVLVKYRTGREAAARSKVLATHHVSTRKTIPKIGFEIVPVPAGDTVQSFLEKLKADPDVEVAETDQVMRALYTPSDDPDFSSQYALDTSHINAVEAWDISRGTNTVVVAVIDTGITTTHQDLNDNYSSGVTIEIDWNGDGDCTDTFLDVGPEQCASNDPTDDNTGEHHGTRVSGIIAAEDNTVNMIGVAHLCRILAVKALNASGAGSYSAIAEGIVYAADHGASVINMSLGGSSSDSTGAVQEAVRYAVNTKHVVVVAAAGNDGNTNSVNFPASIPDVIAVGATESNNTIASFSCTGTALDLVAPGVGIHGTIPVNSTSADDGTSFSAPLVAGVAALIRSIDPNMSVQKVTNHINFTATDLGATGYDTTFGFGRLNALRAVQSAQNGTVYITNIADTPKTYPYPNPFRPGVTALVQFSIPNNTTATTADGVEITIYNTAGEEVKKLTNTVEWDGKNDSGNYVASGLYYYFAKTPGGEFKGKLTVIK